MPDRVRAHGASSRGRRSENQDAWLSDAGAGVFAVADGMGGTELGGQASAAAVAALRSACPELGRLTDHMRRGPRPELRQQLAAQLRAVFADASARVEEIAARAGEGGAGTTLTIAVLAGDQLVVAHVGDTRAYLVRGSTVEQLTEDHSVAALRLRRGRITPEQYRASPQRSVLYDHLGNGQEPDPDLVEAEIQPGDAVLLCSDGVWEFLSRDEVGRGARSSLAGAPDRCTRTALRRGSSDNCTAVVVQVPGEAMTSTNPIVPMLQKVALLQGLSLPELRILAPFMRLHIGQPDEPIVRQGEVGRELFLLVRGRVRVDRHGVALTFLESGSHFGELSLALAAPRAASVIATEPSYLVVLDQGGLHALQAKRPDLAVLVQQRLLEAMGARLLEMTDRAIGRG